MKLSTDSNHRTPNINPQPAVDKSSAKSFTEGYTYSTAKH